MGQSASEELLRDECDEPVILSGRRDFGFSAVELMLVIALLAVVIGSLVPQMLAASERARHDAVLQDLLQFRRQIEQFTLDHDGRRPAQGTNSEESFVGQLLGKTTHTGAVRDDGHYGPYLLGDLPVNPVTGSSRVLVVPDPLRAHHFGGHGEHGWSYSSETGEIRANISSDVVDQGGRPVNTM